MSQCPLSSQTVPDLGAREHVLVSRSHYSLFPRTPVSFPISRCHHEAAKDTGAPLRESVCRCPPDRRVREIRATAWHVPALPGKAELLPSELVTLSPPFCWLQQPRELRSCRRPGQDLTRLPRTVAVGLQAGWHLLEARVFFEVFFFPGLQFVGGLDSSLHH